MAAWKLSSEPWLFLIDAKGTVVGRYEGGITKEELGPALEKLIAGQPVF
jgi:glutathione peroxidase-family protein